MLLIYHEEVVINLVLIFYIIMGLRIIIVLVFVRILVTFYLNVMTFFMISGVHIVFNCRVLRCLLLFEIVVDIMRIKIYGFS
jgi:hypothetical protein